MKKLLGFLFSIVFFILFFTITPVFSANYSFYVDKNTVNVDIKKDGSVDIEYHTTFTTSSGAKAIDIVDIGLPNKYYSLSSAKASVDDYNLNTVRPSSYISVGVEIPLESHEIKPGESKTLNFKINNPKMIYQDDADQNYSAVEFYTNYFGSQYTKGTSDLTVNFILPAGVTKDQIITRHDPNVTFSDKNGRLVVTWNNPKASPSTQYKFGISFPKEYVDTVYPASEYTPASSYYSYSSSSSSSNSFNAVGCIAPLAYIIFFVIIISSSIIAHRGMKNKYFPPNGVVEGFGANKTLKPAELALLSQLPLARVSSILLARLIKLGIVQEINHKREIVRINEDPELLAKLYKFEKDYFEILKFITPAYNRNYKRFESKIKRYFVNFIKDTAKKVDNYSRHETKKYYDKIIKGLWDEINSYNETDNLLIKRKISNILDTDFILLMADKDFPRKIKPILADKQIPKPKWILDLKKSKASLSQRVADKEIESDLAEDYYDDSYEFYLDIFDGFDYYSSFDFDDTCLSVAKSTNPAAFATSSSYGGGGGGCACACACACAGGGR